MSTSEKPTDCGRVDCVTGVEMTVDEGLGGWRKGSGSEWRDLGRED